MPDAFQQISTQERRGEVFRLRIEGFTYKEIAAKVLEKFGGKKLPAGWDDRYANKDVRRHLAKVKKNTWDKAEETLMVEVRRLNEMQHSIWVEFQNASGINEKKKCVETYISLQKRKAKFLGLDEPEKIEMLMANMGSDEVEGFKWAQPDEAPEYITNGHEEQ